MKTLHAQRLMKLARFLYNELPEEKFDFSSVVRGDDIPNRKYDCGTVACAIGWMPHVWPRRFKFVKLGDGPVYMLDSKLGKRMGFKLNADVLWDFFGTGVRDSDMLFAPYNQHLNGYPSLTNDSTGKEVAANIALYVRRQLPKFDVSL